MEAVTLFWGASKLLQMVTEAMKLIHLLLGTKATTNLDSVLKNREITFFNQGLYIQHYGFSSNPV